MKFRTYSGENDILFEVIRRAVESLSFEGDWQLIDAGTGDGVLISRVLESHAFVQPPTYVTLVESCISLMQRAKGCFNSFSPIVKDRVKFLRCPLSSLSESDLHCSQGLVLAIHSTYYFDQSDLEKLTWLRARNFRVLVIENNTDCWVARIMRSIGNTRQPQFDEGRFQRVLGSLGPNNITVEVECCATKKQKLKLWHVFALLGFFTFYQNSTVGERTSSKELIKQMWNDDTRDSLFVYRCIKAGWSRPTGLDDS
jgi:hypothetical protein